MKAITTKYHGPTGTRGSRISASDSDGNRVSVPYQHDRTRDGEHDTAALALCSKMKWKGVLVRGSADKGNVYVFLDDSAIVHIPEATA